MLPRETGEWPELRWGDDAEERPRAVTEDSNTIRMVARGRNVCVLIAGIGIALVLGGVAAHGSTVEDLGFLFACGGSVSYWATNTVYQRRRRDYAKDRQVVEIQWDIEHKDRIPKDGIPPGGYGYQPAGLEQQGGRVRGALRRSLLAARRRSLFAALARAEADAELHGRQNDPGVAAIRRALELLDR